MFPGCGFDQHAEQDDSGELRSALLTLCNSIRVTEITPISLCSGISPKWKAEHKTQGRKGNSSKEKSIREMAKKASRVTRN